MIRYSGASFAWNSGGIVHQIADISLTVGQGERVGLFGRSGTGKSTLLRLAVGELRPDSGSVEAHTGSGGAVYHDQVQKLLPWLSGKGNVRLAQRVSENEYNTIIEVCGLQGFGDRNATALSGGQRARVALARTLAANAPVMLLDEPFSGVDVQSQEQIADFLAGLDNSTMMITAHDPGLLIQLCARILCLHTSGRSVAGHLFERDRSMEGLAPGKIRSHVNYIEEVKRLQGAVYV